MLLTSGNTVVRNYEYDAYGKEKDGSSADENPFRYSGEYFDSETGFIYLRNRYYDPSSARFISEDPIRDGYNWYAYCEGNPINFIDPWGLRNVVAIAGSDKNSDDNVFLDDINTFIEDNPDDVVVVIKAWEYDDWSKIKDAMKDAFGKEGIDVLIIAAHASTSSITLSNDWQRPGRPNIYIDKNTKWNSIKFNKGANIKILGCNAGGMAGQKNMVTEVNEDSDGNFESYTGAIIKFKSIAQIIANKTNTTVWAYTNYTSQKQIGHGYYQTPVNMYGEGKMKFKYMTGMWWWKKEQEMAGTVNNAFTKFERQ